MFWFRRRKSEPEPEPQPLHLPVFVSVDGLQSEASIVVDPESPERAQLWIEGSTVKTECARGKSLQLTVWNGAK